MSVRDWQDAYAVGVLRDIYAFHRYTTNSTCPVPTQEGQFQLHDPRWARAFHNWLNLPSTLPLNPINPDNARILRITAAAGTELADAYSRDCCRTPLVALVNLPQKKFKTRRAVILHATWLVQALAH